MGLVSLVLTTGPQLSTEAPHVLNFCVRTSPFHRTVVQSLSPSTTSFYLDLGVPENGDALKSLEKWPVSWAMMIQEWI